MHRLASPFILERYAAGETHGQFEAASLFVDMSGFSKMTSVLMTHGQHGAEVLATVMRAIFDPLVEAVYAQGGFITNFAGDAFTAVFPAISSSAPSEFQKPDASNLRALAAAWTIRTRMRTHTDYDTPYGQFTVGAKVAMAAGDVQWGIIRDEKGERTAFYFRGPTIEACALAEKQARRGDLVLHRSFTQTLDDGTRAAIAATPQHPGASADDASYLWVSDVQLPLPNPRPIALPLPDADTLTHFFPRQIIDQTTTGEFRQAINVFIGLSGNPSELQLSQFVQTVFELQNNYGGLVNRIDFGDKGCSLLLFWGAPISHENDIVRALNFLLELHDRTRIPIRAGVTSSISHAGFIGSILHEEYTCYGNGVNLAARFMTAAPWETIWVDNNVKLRAEHQLEFEPEGHQTFKGIEEPQAVYTLLGYRSAEAFDLYERSMVGRQEEIAQIEMFVRPAVLPEKEGRFAGILAVMGEAGIGKSRLVHDFQHHYESLVDRQRSFTLPQWFICQTDSIIQQPLNPFRYWLRDYFGVSPTQSEAHNRRVFSRKLTQLVSATRDETLRSQLERSRSFLGSLLDLNWEDSLYAEMDPISRHESTIRAIKTLMLAESRQRPVILVIEDAHWLDEESVQFIRRFVRNIESYPIAILATARPEPQKSLFGSDIEYQTLELNSLSPEDIATLATEVLGGPIAPTLLAQIIERSGGNPFFAEQVVLYLRDENLIGYQDIGWAAADKSIATAMLPGNVRAIFIARLDRLTHDVREVVQAAAVLGREFEAHILTRMLRRQSIQVHISMAEAAAIWTALTEIRYLFRHVLMRDAAYEMQVRTRRAELHYLAAQTIETIHANDLTAHYDEIAYHYETAYSSGIPDAIAGARRYLALAGGRAIERHENNAAADYFTRALALTPDDNRVARFDLTAQRASAYGYMGKRELQAEDLAEIRTLAEALNDDQRRAQAAIDEARYADNVSKFNDSVAAAQRAIAIAERANLPEWEGKAYHEWGNALYRIGEYDESVARLEKSLVIARQYNLLELEAEALHTMGFSLDVQGDYARAMALYEQALAIFRKVNDRSGEMIVLNSIAITQHELGDSRAAWDTFEQALSLARELGRTLAQARYLGNLGELAFKMGKLNEALGFTAQAIQLSREIDHRDGEGSASSNMGIILMRLGEREQARQHLEAAIVIGREVDNPLTVCEATAYLAVLDCWDGQALRALEICQPALKLAQEIGVRYLEGLLQYSIGQAALGLGRTDAAALAYRTALELSEELGQPDRVAESRAGLARAALAANDLASAQHEAESILNHVRQALHAHSDETGLDLADEPLHIYYTCYQVLAAANDARSAQVIQRAYDLLSAQMRALDNDAQRQTFLRNVPHNRLIVEALINQFQNALGLTVSEPTNAELTANVPIVDLSNATLRGAKLIGVLLSRVTLSGADLSQADLRGANLNSANLSGARLSGANLRGAELARADLRGADLVGADLNGADLTGVIYDAHTAWPAGFKAPQ